MKCGTIPAKSVILTVLHIVVPFVCLTMCRPHVMSNINLGPEPKLLENHFSYSSMYPCKQ